MLKSVRNFWACILAAFSLCQCDSTTPDMKIKTDNYCVQKGLKGKVKKICYRDISYYDGKLDTGVVSRTILIDPLGNCTDQYIHSDDGTESVHTLHADFYPNGYVKCYSCSSMDAGEDIFTYTYNSKDNSVIISEYLGVKSALKKFLISMSCVTPSDTSFLRYDTLGNMIACSYRDITDAKVYDTMKFDSSNRLVEEILCHNANYIFWCDTLSYIYTDSGKVVCQNGIVAKRYNAKDDLIEEFSLAEDGRTRYEYDYDSHGNQTEIRIYKEVGMLPDPPVFDSVYNCRKTSGEIIVSRTVMKYDENDNVSERTIYTYNDCEEVINAVGGTFEYEYYE